MVSPFFVGAMERGSEYIREETKKAEDLVDNSIKMWTEMGLPVFRARKKQRRELETVADFLSNKGFSNDQIYEAMRQGKHTAVVDHVTAMEKAGQGYKAADIITFADANYQDTGMTMDQVLDGVMGKVSNGMSLTDAIADSTGKDIGGIQGAIMKRRAGAVKTAFGINPTEFRSLARQEFEYGDKLGGEITLKDPVAAAKATKAMDTTEKGPITQLGALRQLTADAVNRFGGSLVYDATTGEARFSNIIQADKNKATNLGIAAAQVFQRAREGKLEGFEGKKLNSIDALAQANAYLTKAMKTATQDAEDPEPTVSAASALDTIKADMRTNTSWMERGQGRQELVQKLATALVEAGLATDDTAISEAFAIVFATEKQIKEARAAAAAANTGSNQDVNSDFSGGA